MTEGSPAIRWRAFFPSASSFKRKQETSMADVDLSKLDKRTVERYLRTGVIDEKTYEKYRQELSMRLKKE